MRIVAGRWRGRALSPLGKGDADAHLRPTTDRVRESLFNVIGHGGFSGLDGARVLDLFAGTGALGLEALSRGASRASFVENGKVALRLLERNIALLQCSGQAEVLRADAAGLRACERAPYDMVFADPPYGKGLGARAITAAMAGGWLAPGALVVLEEGAETAVPGLVWDDLRRYGGTLVHIGTFETGM